MNSKLGLVQHSSIPRRLSKHHEDLDSTESKQPGLQGLLETVLRKFKIVVHVGVLLPLYALGSVLLGTAIAPGILLFRVVSSLTQNWSIFPQTLAIGAALAMGYFLYGLSMLFLVPLFNLLMRTTPRPFRGPYYSLDTVKWYVHNGLLYLVRYTFLEFVTPTPLNVLFYQMMGMKVGRGSQINSTHISDPALIEMGERVTIGGSAVIVAHYGQAGYLVLAPVKIGKGATVGLRATVMGGAQIGDYAKIMPNSVVMPKTHVPAGEIWGGVPARKLDPRKIPR